MSAYHPPHHNRLLDLELDLRHKQPGATAPSKGPRVRSVQGRRTYRQLVSDPVTPRAEKQPAPRQPKILSLQQQARLGEPQSRRTQAQSGVNRAAATPQNRRPRNSDSSAGSYRRLASQMGKYYNPRKPFAQTPRNDLPEIQTPIRPEVVEDFASAAPPKRKQRPLPSPIDYPTSSSTSMAPQPKCQGLARTIRQARLGIIESEPKATADMRGDNQQREQEWAIDEALLQDPESHGPASDQFSEPAETSGCLFNEPMTRPAQDRTSLHNLPQNEMPAEKDRHDDPPLFVRAPSSPVTIDVIPVDETSNEPNRATPTSTVFTQDLDMAIAIQVEESSLDPAAEAEEAQTNSRPADGNASAPEMSGTEGDAQNVENPTPTAVPMNLKGRVLQFYKLACRPQIEKRLARFQRKLQRLKETHGQS